MESYAETPALGPRSVQHFSKFFESFTVVDDNSPARPENELTHLGLLLASANHAPVETNGEFQAMSWKRWAFAPVVSPNDTQAWISKVIVWLIGDG